MHQHFVSWLLNATRSITCQPAFSIVTVICSVLSSTTQITRLGISIRTGLESRMLRAGHGGRHLLTSRFQSRLLTNCIHRQVSFTRSQLTSNSRTIMASANANAERFFADRASPLCSMDIGKSFGQLRSVWCIYKINVLCVEHLLSSKEKKYTHFLTEASWAGARIIQGWSLESC